jgi:hypothetical protein
MILAFSWGDLAYLALSIFLIVVGLALGYALFRLGGTFRRLTSFIQGAETELIPTLGKLGGTVDRVNLELDKVNRMTDSAVDAVDSVDTAVRTVSIAVTQPVKRAAGLAAGLRHGVADFRANRDLRGAVEAGKEAASRRERDLENELAEGRSK